MSIYFIVSVSGRPPLVGVSTVYSSKVGCSLYNYPGIWLEGTAECPHGRHCAPVRGPSPSNGGTWLVGRDGFQIRVANAWLSKIASRQGSLPGWECEIYHEASTVLAPKCKSLSSLIGYSSFLLCIVNRSQKKRKSTRVQYLVLERKYRGVSRPVR